MAAGALPVKLTSNGSTLRAGEYDFPSPISPLGAFAKLREGQQRLLRLTVVEGWTRWDIANAMSRIPELDLENPTSALPLMDDVSAIQDLDPKATNLEGYLFPDTYEFARDATPAEVIGYMVKRFRKEWKPDWTARANALGLSPREAVTIASLIETEAKLSSERPTIASVIYNRLGKGMALGVDSSVIYASKLAGKWRNDGKVYQSDLDRRSPYNTRLISGLPPGPIASPAGARRKSPYPSRPPTIIFTTLENHREMTELIIFIAMKVVLETASAAALGATARCGCETVTIVP